MEILAIIPARGGSKSIPLKNLQKINKKPLIDYTIETAKKSKYLDRIVVSTDHPKILNHCKKLGVDTPFLRPKKFSLDSSSTLDVVKHTLKFLSKEKYFPDIIIILQPTNPFRKTTLIDQSVRLLKKSNATSVLGVSKITKHPYRAFWPQKNFLQPLNSQFLQFHQRQKHPLCYYPTGEIYTFWRNTLGKYGNYYGPRIKPLISERNEINIDIDSSFDLFISEMKLKYWNSYKKIKKFS